MTAPTPRRLRHLAVAIIAASPLVGAACSSEGGNAGQPAAATSSTEVADLTTTGATAPVVPAGGFQVATHTETLVDPTRPTPDLPETGVPPSAQRTMETTFTYPDVAGAFPLVVFAHGHNGHPRKFTQLFEAWAAAGFVVAAPSFPLSNDEVPGAASVFDLPGQSGDLTFVISEALRRSGEPGDALQGRVNPEEIAVGGLSLGGATVYSSAFDDCCRDRRIDAVMVLDAPHPDASGLDLALGLPLLIMHADGDPVIPYSSAEEAFEAAATPKYLVTIHEAVHASPYEDTPDPADELVLATTTAFWRLHLAHDADAAVELSRAARVPGLTTVVENPG